MLPPKILLMKSSGPPLELSADVVLAGAESGRGRGIGIGPADAIRVGASVRVAGSAAAVVGLTFASAITCGRRFGRGTGPASGVPAGISSAAGSLARGRASATFGFGALASEGAGVVAAGGIGNSLALVLAGIGGHGSAGAAALIVAGLVAAVLIAGAAAGVAAGVGDIVTIEVLGGGAGVFDGDTLIDASGARSASNGPFGAGASVGVHGSASFACCAAAAIIRSVDSWVDSWLDSCLDSWLALLLAGSLIEALEASWWKVGIFGGPT